jgi:methionyl-tRNA formyltransferase
LPKYRGALPTLWTLKNNDTETAVTYIKLEQSADVGKIIAQYNISIPKETTSLELEVLIANSVQKTLVVTILRYLDGSIQLINQDNSIASYTEKYNKYREIEIAKESLAEISNKVNLYPYLDPYVYCFVIVSGKKIEIKKVQYAGFSTKKSTFLVKGLRLYFISEMGSLYARLFLDISIMNSLFLLKSKRR